MTIPAFTGLQTALRGLEATQEAIDTTGQNIANANTPGYSRQRVDLKESAPLVIPAVSNLNGQGTQLGTGVDATSISRIRDQFLDVQYRAQNSNSSYADNQATVLSQVEAGLSEPTDHGVADALNKFWASWNSLATNPSSGPAKQVVINSGQALAQAISTTAQQLSNLKASAQQQYNSLTGPNGQVQTDANQLASLNHQIALAQAVGQTPNDLLDQRDQLLDDLSSLGNISVTPQANGMVNVSLGNASTPLVAGTTVTWPQTLSVPGTGGQLGSLLSLSQTGGQIDQYSSQLDAVAGSLATAVNALQPASPFFSGSTASTLSVVATASTIQSSSAANPGSSDLAQQVAGLSGGAVDSGYAGFVSQIGSDVQSANNTQSTATSLLNAIANQRQSVSGVSLDEEMTNLITFQRGYQASARMMTTLDSMLDTLINHTGTVGL